MPAGGKLEMRVRGPYITPGYWNSPQLTEAAFDDEGYYKIGDALKFADPADPSRGLLFDGRVAEDFKLATGTWVSTGPLRNAVIAAGAPYVQDVVIAGHDRDDVCALIFPAIDACRKLADAEGQGGALATGALLAHPKVRATFQAILDALTRASTGSASRIARALLMEVPPSLDAGEATDKGSLSQRMILQHRAALVAELYQTPASPRTLAASTAK